MFKSSEACGLRGALTLLASRFAGTVVVKPEPVANEAKDEFRGPEFRSRGSKVKEDSARKRPGEWVCVLVMSPCPIKGY